MKRIETIEKTVYSTPYVLENEELKERVLDKWRESMIYRGDFQWTSEILDSERAFRESLPSLEYDLSGLRLRTWIINNYLCDIE